MRDVIQKVIATEVEAKRLVELARAEADRILSGARKEGQERVARVRQEARAEAQRLVEAAIQDTEREKRECLARAAIEIETQVQLEESTRQRAVEGCVRCLCGGR